MTTADTDYHFIHALDIELEELNDSVQEFWIKNGCLVAECQQLLSRVNRHKTNSQIAKSVGTGVSGVGAIALISGIALTPFTGGLSIPVSAILGFGGGAATAMGTVTTVGTDVVDYFVSKKFFTRLSRLAAERNTSAVALSQKLSQFDISLKRTYGLNRVNDVFDEGLGFVTLINLLTKSTTSAYRMGTNSIKLIDAVKEYNAIKVAKTLKSVKSEANVMQTMARSVTSLLPTEAKGLSTGLAKTAVPSTGKLVLRGGTAALGLLFTVVDAVVLVKDWNKAHPTVEAINGLVEDLESDSKLIQSIHTMITTAFNADLINDEFIDEILNAIDCTGSCPPEVITIKDSDDEDNGISVDFNHKSVSYNKSYENEP